MRGICRDVRLKSNAQAPKGGQKIPGGTPEEKS